MNSKPRYQQVKDYVLSQLESGALQAKDRVPSENELVEKMNVSRMTANRALRELNDEGLLVRIAGVGTFVADIKATSHVLEVHNIADEIEHRGHRHSALVLQLSRQHARGEIARALHLGQGEDVFHVLVVHRENEIPIQLEDRYVRAEFATDCLQQDFTVITPSAYLSNISPLQEAEHSVQAVMPNAAVRGRLQMKADEPCLLVMRRTWSRGLPVSFARLHHPGSRYELTGRFAPTNSDNNEYTQFSELGRQQQ
jgi:GntR family histidine utilization transcriptional repressor